LGESLGSEVFKLSGLITPIGETGVQIFALCPDLNVTA
jgi:hypothetical protein